MLDSILGGLKDQIPGDLLQKVGLDSSKAGDVANIAGDAVSVELNWTGVNSFTVETDVDVILAFDNLIVQNFPLQTDDFKVENILVYPNPVNNYLTLKNVENIEESSIYNSLGQFILSTKETLIDLSKLTNGIYYLKIRTQNGTEIKKIIKK